MFLIVGSFPLKQKVNNVNCFLQKHSSNRWKCSV